MPLGQIFGGNILPGPPAGGPQPRPETIDDVATFGQKVAGKKIVVLVISTIETVGFVPAQVVIQLVTPPQANQAEEAAIAALQERERQEREARAALPPVPQLPMHTADP